MQGLANEGGNREVSAYALLHEINQADAEDICGMWTGILLADDHTMVSWQALSADRWEQP